jgi:hypothetical protein
MTHKDSKPDDAEEIAGLGAAAVGQADRSGAGRRGDGRLAGDEGLVVGCGPAQAQDLNGRTAQRYPQRNHRCHLVAA